MTSFDSRILALRGNPSQTEATIKALGGFARKIPTAGDNYVMEHTAGVFLVDAKGQFKGMLDMYEPRETRLQKLLNLVTQTTN